MSEQIKLVLVGAGGHAESCADIIQTNKNFKIIGLVDNSKVIGDACFGYEVIGDDDALPELRQAANAAFIAVGQIKTSETRQLLFQRLQQLEFFLPSFIAPSAFVSANTSIGPGSIIMAGAVVNAGAVIGANCIINSRALIEHNVEIRDHCHISTGAIINGGVCIGEGSFVGSGAVLKNDILVGSNVVVGMGVILRRSLSDGQICVESRP